MAGLSGSRLPGMLLTHGTGPLVTQRLQRLSPLEGACEGLSPILDRPNGLYTSAARYCLAQRQQAPRPLQAFLFLSVHRARAYSQGEPRSAGVPDVGNRIGERQARQGLKNQNQVWTLWVPNL